MADASYFCVLFSEQAAYPAMHSSRLAASLAVDYKRPQRQKTLILFCPYQNINYLCNRYETS